MLLRYEADSVVLSCHDVHHKRRLCEMRLIFTPGFFSKKCICSSILRPGGIFPDGKGGLREDSSSCVNVTHHKCAPFGRRRRRCAQPPKSDICAPTLHPSNIFCDRSKPKYCGTLLLPHLPHSYVSGLCYSGNQRRESQIF